MKNGGGGRHLSEPLCHPTLASPLPPSYEEGAPRRRRVRIFGSVPSRNVARAGLEPAPTGDMEGYSIQPTPEVIETWAAVGGGPYGVD